MMQFIAQRGRRELFGASFFFIPVLSTITQIHLQNRNATRDFEGIGVTRSVLAEGSHKDKEERQSLNYQLEWEEQKDRREKQTTERESTQWSRTALYGYERTNASDKENFVFQRKIDTKIHCWNSSFTLTSQQQSNKWKGRRTEWKRRKEHKKQMNFKNESQRQKEIPISQNIPIAQTVTLHWTNNALTLSPNPSDLVHSIPFIIRFIS